MKQLSAILKPLIDHYQGPALPSNEYFLGQNPHDGGYGAIVRPIRAKDFNAIWSNEESYAYKAYGYDDIFSIGDTRPEVVYRRRFRVAVGKRGDWYVHMTCKVEPVAKLLFQKGVKELEKHPMTAGSKGLAGSVYTHLAQRKPSTPLLFLAEAHVYWSRVSRSWKPIECQGLEHAIQVTLEESIYEYQGLKWLCSARYVCGWRPRNYDLARKVQAPDPLETAELIVFTKPITPLEEMAWEVQRIIDNA